MASLIDDFILLVALSLAAVALSSLFPFSSEGMIGVGGVLAVGTVIGLPWGYKAGFEASAYQATPGKWVLGMKVTDLEGDRIGFGNATGRYFGRIVSVAVFYVGYFMAGWTEKKQALHDKMAGCLVVDDGEEERRGT